MKLNNFFIKGERCSGTNYLEKLIETNLSVSSLDSLEWKHGYLSFGATDSFDKPKIDYLAIFIFRNVFDWLRSFYLTPHHLEGAKSAHWEIKPTFSEFIRREVRTVDEKNYPRNMDRHPLYLDNPQNLLELRKWKTENWLNYKKLSKPVYYLKYEDLVNNPEHILNEINNEWFGVDFIFKNWDFYQKDITIKYKPKKYFQIRDDDLKYLIDTIDWDIEKQIGYDKDLSLSFL